MRINCGSNSRKKHIMVEPAKREPLSELEKESIRMEKAKIAKNSSLRWKEKEMQFLESTVETHRKLIPGVFSS